MTECCIFSSFVGECIIMSWLLFSWATQPANDDNTAAASLRWIKLQPASKQASEVVLDESIEEAPEGYDAQYVTVERDLKAKKTNQILLIGVWSDPSRCYRWCWCGKPTRLLK